MLFNLFSPVAPDPSVPYLPGANVAFTIGSLSIDWYGIFVTIGFVLAIVLSILKLKLWYKVKTDPFYYYCLMGIPLAIIGARFWSCCIGDGHWNEFFLFWRGGLAIQGGVIADIILALWWFPFILKKPKYRVRDALLSPEKPAVRQVSMWVYADAIIPCILIGQIVGRWGNYFNQEVYGLLITPTDGNMWFLNFMSKVLPYMYVNDLGGYVQPLFLYEGMINFVGLIFLYVCMEFIPKVKSGTIGMSYFLWYGIVRIIVWWWNSMVHKCSISSCQRKINSLEKKIDKNSKQQAALKDKHDQESLNKSAKLSTKIKKYQADLKKSNQRLEYLNQKQLNTKLRFEKAKSTFVRTHENYLYYLGR